MNKRLVELLAGLLFTLNASIAQAMYVYDVARSLSCTSGCVGNITVEGTLEVDSLGTLAASNFIDWTLTFNSTDHSNTVLTPSNSTILLGGPGGSVVATMNELVITQPGATEPGSFIFGVSDAVLFPYIVVWQFQGGNFSPAEEIISNAPRTNSSAPFDQGTLTYNDDPLVVTLPRHVSAIPLNQVTIPPYLPVIAAFGFGVLIFLGRHRRQRG